MTHRLGHVAGSLVCALFLIVACGGSSFEESDDTPGGDSGASNTAGASGEANAGSVNGGSASGGGASAGSSSGGTTSDGGVTSGGSSSGGVTSGGSSSGGGIGSGGSSSGGGISSGGGTSTACNEDGDCVACAYPTAPTKAADCYCASCAGTPLSKTACATNKAAWEANCTTNPTPCPAIACILPPVPACRSHMCVAK